MEHSLPADAIAAIENGQMIEAIRIVRKKTGLDLKQCKDLVDAYGSGHPVQPKVQPHRPVGDATLPAEAIEAIRRGDKLGAIKMIRAQSGLGLKECVEMVERWETGGTPPAAADLTRVEDSSTNRWLLFLLIAVAASAYLLYSRV